MVCIIFSTLNREGLSKCWLCNSDRFYLKIKSKWMDINICIPTWIYNTMNWDSFTYTWINEMLEKYNIKVSSIAKRWKNQFYVLNWILNGVLRWSRNWKILDRPILFYQTFVQILSNVMRSFSKNYFQQKHITFCLN